MCFVLTVRRESLAASPCAILSAIVSTEVVISFFQNDGSVVCNPLVYSIMRGKITLTSAADASFLLNALLDGIVDHALPVVEFYSAEIAAIEREVLDRPQTKLTKELHLIQGELLLIQRVVGPMYTMITHLTEKQRDTYAFISDLTRVYLRDVLVRRMIFVRVKNMRSKPLLHRTTASRSRRTLTRSTASAMTLSI